MNENNMLILNDNNNILFPNSLEFILLKNIIFNNSNLYDNIKHLSKLEELRLDNIELGLMDLSNMYSLQYICIHGRINISSFIDFLERFCNRNIGWNGYHDNIYVNIDLNNKVLNNIPEQLINRLSEIDIFF